MAVEFLAPAGLGLDVPVAKVSSALKQLWKEGEGAVTRASLINLVIYSEQPDSLETNSASAAEITRDHACRVLLVERGTAGLAAAPQAWITAHCHVSRAGAKQVCCEQVAFRLTDNENSLLANVVLGNLDSDLPLFLWWQAALPASVERQLWSRVDRLLFDSATWPNLAAQLPRMKAIQASSSRHVTFCDLDWARLLSLRLALAQLHDQPGAAAALQTLAKLELHHGRNGFSCAGMLAWFCRQLSWKLEKTAEGARLVKPDGQPPCEVRFVETSADGGVQRVQGSGGYEFEVGFNDARDLVLGSVALADGHRFTLTAPGQKPGVLALVSQELERGSEHRMYPEILEILAPLLA